MLEGISKAVEDQQNEKKRIKKYKEKKKMKKKQRRGRDSAHSDDSRSSSSSESSDEPITKEAIEQAKSKLTPEEKQRIEIRHQRESLPMYPYRDELLAAIRDNQILVIVAETGSGKTT